VSEKRRREPSQTREREREEREREFGGSDVRGHRDTESVELRRKFHECSGLHRADEKTNFIAGE
jgi:hypothetical protein